MSVRLSVHMNVCPSVLQSVRTKQYLLSAFGAMLQQARPTTGERMKPCPPLVTLSLMRDICLAHFTRIGEIGSVSASDHHWL